MKTLLFLHAFLLCLESNEINYMELNSDGPDIWFIIRYPAKSSHFSAIRYLAGYRISKIRYPVSEYQTFLLSFEDLRCFNYLSNSVEQRTGIEISGIRHPPDIRPEIRYLVLRMAGYPAKLLSSPSLL